MHSVMVHISCAVLVDDIRDDNVDLELIIAIFNNRPKRNLN